MFDSLYTPYAEERKAFGSHWCGPDRYEYGDWTLCAQYAKDPADGDGQNVDVYCSACPARFYKIVARPTPNSCNEPQEGFILRFGTGSERLVAQIAHEIARGMIDARPYTEDNTP